MVSLHEDSSCSGSEHGSDEEEEWLDWESLTGEEQDGDPSEDEEDESLAFPLGVFKDLFFPCVAYPPARLHV